MSSSPWPAFMWAVAAALLLLPSPTAAQTWSQVGERSQGMGGAFVAVADDASAIYWNPAGLATGRARLSASGHPDALPVLDARRNPHRELPRSTHASPASALVARMLHDPTVPVALFPAAFV